MKAIVYKKYGSPDVLQLMNVEKPRPGENDVLIKVHAAEVTKSDCELRSFNFPVKWFWLPLRIALGVLKPKRQVLGGYFAGVVVSAGSHVTKFKEGDPVFGSTKLRLGAYGEYMCLPDSYTLVLKPVNISFEEAAAVPLGGLNALHFMRKANIRKGEAVLINGAGGSIGSFGIQIAKSMGAEVTVVDSSIKESLLRGLGADDFIDYTREDVMKSSKTYDVIFNMVAGSSYSGCLKLLRPGGRYLMANPRISDMIRSVFTSMFTNKTSLFTFAGETEEELITLKEMIEDKKIKTVVDQIFPLKQAAEAHRRVEAEKRQGPVVITMGAG